MRYDIVFVRRSRGQSWAEALAARSGGTDGSPGADPDTRPLDKDRTDAWDRLASRAESILGPVELGGTDARRVLRHPSTGIELELAAEQAELSLPFGATGDAALRVMEQVYAIGRAVEQETGLEGYDLQLDEPLTDAVQGAAAEARAVATAREEDDASSGAGPMPPPSAWSPPTFTDDAPPPEEPPEPSTRPPWWAFWRR